MRSKIVALLLLLTACAHRIPVKETIIPLKSGTKFRLGSPHGYAVSFQVPFGTPVISVEDGVVVYVKSEGTKGGCGKENEGHGHMVFIKHSDGTVAQYLHLTALVKQQQKVQKGEVIAMTANNGIVCEPNLYFREFATSGEMVKGQSGKTIPLRFSGIPAGPSDLNYEGVTP